MANFLKNIKNFFQTAPIKAIPAPLSASNNYNLLVISDLHLGEDLSEFGGQELIDLINNLNNTLSAMLDYFAQRQFSNQPWQLVMNGDTFDFLKMSLRHQAPTADPDWREKASDTARKKINTLTPAQIVEVLKAICRAHQPIMNALSNFVIAGNRLELVSGNHDLELWFPEVQTAFKDFLWEQAVLNRTVNNQPDFTAEDKQKFYEQINFHPWFFCYPGRCFIQHGHLSDLWCSVSYPLLPLIQLDPPLTAIPFVQRSMPYIEDILPDFSTHNIETLSIPQLLLSLKWRDRRAIGKAMLAALKDLSQESAPEKKAKLEAKAKKLFQDFSQNCPYSSKQLQALQKLIVSPMRLSLPKLLKECAIVRDSIGDLRKQAAAIHQITGEPVVISGHSHLPEALKIKLNNNYYFNYFNSGSWVSREVELGSKGIGQTFIIIINNDCQLFQWLGNELSFDGRPYRPYVPSLELKNI